VNNVSIFLEQESIDRHELFFFLPSPLGVLEKRRKKIFIFEDEKEG